MKLLAWLGPAILVAGVAVDKEREEISDPAEAEAGPKTFCRKLSVSDRSRE
jgi:hypothetical protein